MNEFEWRRELRDLRQPLAPQRDLWLSIDAALDAADPARLPATPAKPAHQASHRLRWLAAASCAGLALLAGGMGWHLQHVSAAMPFAGTTMLPTSWKPADPRMAGAAIELDAARMELQQAILQAPDSAALQRLLVRTEHQQTQLRQLVHDAG